MFTLLALLFLSSVLATPLPWKREVPQGLHLALTSHRARLMTDTRTLARSHSQSGESVLEPQ